MKSYIPSMSSPFTIVPKDKRILKSSKVREWFKTVNAIMEPTKQEIMDKANEAIVNEIVYGHRR